MLALAIGGEPARQAPAWNARGWSSHAARTARIPGGPGHGRAAGGEPSRGREPSLAGNGPGRGILADQHAAGRRWPGLADDGPRPCLLRSGDDRGRVEPGGRWVPDTDTCGPPRHHQPGGTGRPAGHRRAAPSARAPTTPGSRLCRQPTALEFTDPPSGIAGHDPGPGRGREPARRGPNRPGDRRTTAARSSPVLRPAKRYLRDGRSSSSTIRRPASAAVWNGDLPAAETLLRPPTAFKAVIGDRVFYVTVDGAHKPEIHEAWVEEADESDILVRSTASASGEVGATAWKTRRLNAILRCRQGPRFHLSALVRIRFDQDRGRSFWLWPAHLNTSRQLTAARSRQRCPPAGATVRRVMRQKPSVRRSSWVIAAAARMAGGAAGSMISSTDRAMAGRRTGRAR